MMELGVLFVSFARVGLLSFGGGYGMIPVLIAEVTSLRGWLTTEQLIDVFAIAEITPGPVVINAATFVGYKVGGVPGSIAATVGVIFLPLVIVMIMSLVLSRYRTLPVVKSLFWGLRTAVLALVLMAFVQVGRLVLVDWAAFALMVGTLCVLSFTKLHPVLVLLISGAIGALLL